MRWSPGLTKGGLLSTISVSFLASTAALMPFVILGFLIRIPLIAVSGLIVLFVVLGLIDIVRSGAWRQWKEQSISVLRIEAAVLAVGCFIQYRVGSLMGADALIHMARVRQMTDHGLTNADPFIKGDFFYPIYHTNIYHVLLASCSQLTQVHYLDVWYGVLPVIFVLVASAIYFMTYQVFANRWAAWFAAMFFMVDQGHVNFLSYPNKVSPFFLLPLMIGFVVRALRTKPSYKDAVPIAFTSLALGMFHGMYAFFGVILLGPAVFILGIQSYLRKEGVLKKYALCGLALMLALPWPMITKRVQEGTRIETIRARIERDRDPESIHLASANVGKKKTTLAANSGSNAFFRSVAFGLIMKKPFRGFGGGVGLFGLKGFRYQYLIVGLILGFFSTRRRQYFIAASVALATLAYLLFPPLCTILFEIMEAKWMLQRLETAGLTMMFPTLVFGSIIYHLDTWLKRFDGETIFKKSRVMAAQGLIGCVLLIFAFSYSDQWKTWHSFTKEKPFTSRQRNWSANYHIAMNLTAKQRQSKVRTMKRLRKFYQEKIPPGSNVIVRDNMALELVTLHDAHILNPIRSSVGVPDLSYYRRLNKRLLSPTTKWELRKRILKYVDCNLYIPQGSRAHWLDGHVKAYWGMKQGNAKLVEINLDE